MLLPWLTPQDTNVLVPDDEPPSYVWVGLDVQQEQEYVFSVSTTPLGRYPMTVTEDRDTIYRVHPSIESLDDPPS